MVICKSQLDQSASTHHKNADELNRTNQTLNIGQGLYEGTAASLQDVVIFELKSNRVDT